MKKYIDLSGSDYTEFIKTNEDKSLFEKMIYHQEKTKGVLAKNCLEDIILVLKIDRQLKGGDPNTIIIAKTPLEGLAKLQAFSKATQN